MPEAKGKLKIMGNIETLEDGNTQEHPMALLIEFDSPEDIRAAIKSGKCEFTFAED